MQRCFPEFVQNRSFCLRVLAAPSAPPQVASPGSFIQIHACPMRLKEPQKNCRSKLLVQYHGQGTRSRRAALAMRFFLAVAQENIGCDGKKGEEGGSAIFSGKEPSLPGSGRKTASALPASRGKWRAVFRFCTPDVPCLCVFSSAPQRGSGCRGYFFLGIPLRRGRVRAGEGKVSTCLSGRTQFLYRQVMAIRLIPWRSGSLPVFTSPELR